jgi:rhodanese-related sulfurtransferase
LNRKSVLLSIACVSSLCVASQVPAADIPTDDNGNRYNQPRFYQSEISASAAYLEMIRNKGVVIDVRTRREYAAGHPERAYNVPHPRIDTGMNQVDSVFYWAVYDIVKGKTDTPITTLCRTGARSIKAANILADPASFGIVGGVPFTKVRNNWEGFVGLYKYAFIGSPLKPDPDLPLDLSNDGFINVDAADVYAHTLDENPDKDGWRNFQGLPWTSQIRKPLAYLQDVAQYSCWQTDAGCQP